MVNDGSNTRSNREPAVENIEEPPPIVDERAAPRVTLLLRTAKLIAGTCEHLCVIRDASETGIKLRLFHSVPANVPFFLETSNGDRYSVEMVWTEGDHAGFRFLDRIDLDRLIKDPHDLFPKRQIRLNNQLWGTIILPSGVADVTFENISQQGACIECDRYLAIDQMVVIEGDKIPPLQAKVRWRSRPRYGLIFEQTFQIEELARRLAPQATRPPDRGLGRKRG